MKVDSITQWAAKMVAALVVTIFVIILAPLGCQAIAPSNPTAVPQPQAANRLFTQADLPQLVIAASDTDLPLASSGYSMPQQSTQTQMNIVTGYFTDYGEAGSCHLRSVVILFKDSGSAQLVAQGTMNAVGPSTYLLTVTGFGDNAVFVNNPTVSDSFLGTWDLNNVVLAVGGGGPQCVHLDMQAMATKMQQRAKQLAGN